MLASRPVLKTQRPLTDALSRPNILRAMKRLEVVDSPEGLDDLQPDWDRLHRHSGAGVFLSWAWLRPWHNIIAPDRRLHIVTLRNGLGEMEGVVPLCIEDRPLLGSRFGPTVRRMAYLGETNVGSDYLDVIAHSSDRDRTTRRLLEATRDSSLWDLLDLNDMDSQSPTLPLLREVFGGPEFVVETIPGPICPYEPLAPGETFSSFIKALGRGDNYKRRRKWLEKQEGYKILRATEPHEMDGALKEFLRLHELRWRGDGGSDGITCPETERFHHEATRLLAERGNICLYTMLVGDTAVASFYALMHGGKMICYLTGRDPEWQSKSVGMVLVGETFKDAFELGMSEYDFLRGEEGYKADWSTARRSLVSIRIYRKATRGAWLARQERATKSARHAGKKVLPPALVERLRKLR